MTAESNNSPSKLNQGAATPPQRHDTMKKRIYTTLFKNILDAVDEKKLFNDSPTAFAELVLLKKSMDKAGKRLGKEIIILDID